VINSLLAQEKVGTNIWSKSSGAKPVAQLGADVWRAAALGPGLQRVCRVLEADLLPLMPVSRENPAALGWAGAEPPACLGLSWV